MKGIICSFFNSLHLQAYHPVVKSTSRNYFKEAPNKCAIRNKNSFKAFLEYSHGYKHTTAHFFSSLSFLKLDSFYIIKFYKYHTILSLNLKFCTGRKNKMSTLVKLEIMKSKFFEFLSFAIQPNTNSIASYFSFCSKNNIVGW